MTKEQLIELAKAVSNAKTIYQALAMANTYGLSPEDRVELDARYMIARDEMAAAEQRYNTAMIIYTRSSGLT